MLINDDIILMTIMKKFNNIDVINNIYDYYLIDKYFGETINNKSIQLFKNRFIHNKDKIEKITKIIKPKIFNIINIKKLLLNDEITIKFLEKIPILIKYLNYSYKNNKELILTICKIDKTLIKYASNELK